LIPPTTTTKLPLVGYGGSLLVESRKNGQKIVELSGGII
jgi:hypothetical protein